MATRSSPGTPARTLADQLRSWSDGELVRLLEARPDLATPTPQDSAQLASRAGTRSSALRAVDQLTVLELTVVDAVIALGGSTTLKSLQEHVNASRESVAAAVDRLTAMALLWGSPELRAVSILGELVGTTVSGLGPSAETLLSTYGPSRVTALARDLGLEVSGDRHTDVRTITRHLADRKAVDLLVDEVAPQARTILDHLEREGTDGSVESTERSVSRSSAAGPVDQLLARGLLVARDRRHVAVPREVAICLRGGFTTRGRVDEMPALATSEREQTLVDRAAAGAAFELVRHVELLLEHWGTAPPSALRTGGLGVRELKAAAELLHLEERTAALHIEVASAAGLVAVGSTDDHDSAWLPTDAFDVWSGSPVADRWATLALAWLDSPRLTGLVGGRDENRKPVNALVPDLERMWLPETRRTALGMLAELPDGRVLAAGTGTSSLVERVRWHRPRRPAQRAEAVAWCVEESAVLGLTGLGGLSAHGRALLTTEDPRHSAPAALQPLLPQPVDHILLQADLTAVAPGPLEHDLAHNLATMADIESRGGATVYRFTATSVRRAFDSGWSVGEVHDFIAASSRTEVPQPLVYLVDDVSRRFGTVRVGAASSFLRSDDESALAELVHNPKASSLRLRRIAPTVVVSDVPVDVLLPRLRELGTAPVVEAPDGTVRLARREAHRARSHKHRPPVHDLGLTPGPLDAKAAARLTARIAATVGAIRAGDQAAASRPANEETGRLSRTTPMSTMATLREAVEARATVWIGYVDNHGSTVERVVDPVRVEGGWLTAYDHRADDVRSFAIHRITGVNPVR
ncbi:helicase C-terminal domain-containing protein [Nocardioides sp. WL0053]|uniref:Helicase C-terminal domain-containing protein n=1 Tax=Nocardioides jiangsuensis TaxID=2866161 RepID=A0ABS7RJ99_9ACTN|nr:helicase C-terminal domain-containing protein [Nocardioides jiangsuensis]MBY9075091.1 helicase C-terminal domain-containing protein [Nocardioides jiangsuensis]